MSITLSALQKQRRDTAANWTAANPTLLAGEIGLESDTGYWKVGDGSTAWTNLAYVSGLGAEIPVNRLADGDARQILQTASNGVDVEWTSNVALPGTLGVTGAATFDSAVTIQGNLTVNGTTTNINTQNLVVEDKNIIVGDVSAPSDAIANGGGITLKGATDKTINWINATSAWTSSEHLDLASGKAYYINGTLVLSSSTLGSGVTGSSLSSVGTIGTGVWQGTAISDTYLQTISTAGKVSNSATTATSLNTANAIVARNASGNFTAGTITATSFSGSGASLTSLTAGNLSGTIPSNVLGNSTVYVGTTAVALNRSSANQALTGINSIALPGAISGTITVTPAATAGTTSITIPATNGTLITTGDAGTVTSAMLAGSIAPSQITGTAITAADTGTVTSTMIADGTISNADVNASAAIAGTKISPDFGSQNTVTTGTSTAASFSPSSSTVPANGFYLPAANTVAFAAGGGEGLRVTNDSVICYNQSAPISKSALATLTITELKTGIIQYTGAAATLTLPTGTLTEGGFTNVYTNMTFEWSVINTGSGTCTIGNNTGHNVTGGATIANGSSGRFATRRTGANTFISYRLS